MAGSMDGWRGSDPGDFLRSDLRRRGRRCRPGQQCQRIGFGSGLRASGCQPVSLSSSFGSVQIELPAQSSYDVEAETSFGRVQSDFPVAAQSGRDRSEIRGRIGRGGCKLEIRNRNGGIVIGKS